MEGICISIKKRNEGRVNESSLRDRFPFGQIFIILHFFKYHRNQRDSSKQTCMDRIDKTRIDFDEEFMEDRRETRIVKYGLNVSPIFRSGPIKFRSILRFQLAVSI